MKTNYLLLFLVLSFLFACEGERIDFSIINRSIEVNARIEGVKTRAANDTWSPGDAIGIYMVTSGSPLSTVSAQAKNARYTTPGDGTFTPATVANDVKFPLDGSDVDFIAYYPHATINAAFEYSINVTDQSNQAAIDLLYSDNANGLNKNSPSVDFTFSHQLSKIVVHLVTIDGSPLTDVTATIKGVFTKGKFSLADKTQTVTSSSKGNVKMKVSGDGTTAEAIVLPAATLSGATLEITNGLYGYVFDLNGSANITGYDPGFKYTYTLTLDTRPPLNAMATITNWTDVPGEEATLVKDFEVYLPVGAGTQEDPYTIEDARNLSPLNEVWVKGYIVGYYTGSSLSTFSTDLTDETKIKDSSLALAASPTEVTASNTFPVQLPAGSIREALNLKTNPGNRGKEVKMKGNIATYYGGIGMLDVSAYEFISPAP